MKVGDPVRDNSNMSPALRRKVEDNWRRRKSGLRVQKKPPRVNDDRSQNS